MSGRLPALGFRFAILCCLSLLLMTLDHRDQHLGAVRAKLSAATYPLKVIVATPVTFWRWLDESRTSRNELVLENSRLKAERLLTKAKLQKYAALDTENARLRAMLEAKTTVSDQVRIAGIMAVDANPYRHSLVIDKGTRDGVYDGQAMVDSSGVVGQVTQADTYSAQAILISDPDHALPVEINRNGLRTIAVGTGVVDRLDLPFLPNNADIRDGDLLVTSGLGGAFPAGYPVAVVNGVVRLPTEPFAKVSAKPTAALNQIREVMLIFSANKTPEVTDER